MTLPETRVERELMLMVIIMLNSLTLAQRLDCEGTVLDANHKPVKNATVSIYTAKVKTGTSPYCPSCYADCRKQARTDEKGRFVIRALDTELRFTILVVAEGYCPKFTGDVDPGKGPIDVVLSPLAAKRLAPSHVMRGRVVGPDGSPVVGAMVEPVGVAALGAVVGRIMRCDPNEVDPLAVTGKQGEFFLTAEAPDLTVWVTVRAPGLAACHYRSLSAGSSIHEIRLSQGCIVKGRLIWDDVSIEGATIGVVQIDRRVGGFFGEYITGLRKDGRFEIDNLPPNMDYYVYGKMGSLQEWGAVSVRQFRTGDDGSEVDVGELTLDRGHSMTGHVALSDGKPIPYKTRLVISREDAWDSLICELDEQGRFHARHLPTGNYRIVVYVKGYHMSSKNSDFASPDRLCLRGTINGDIGELMVLLEPDRMDFSSPHDEPKKEGPASGLVLNRGRPERAAQGSAP